MRANHGNGTELGAVERKLRILIPEQNNTFLRHVLRDIEIAIDINGAAHGRIVDDAAGKLRS